MITKIVASKPVRSFDRTLGLSPSHAAIFGKPTKPRFTEPTMYQILSWKEKSLHQDHRHSQQLPQNTHLQTHQPISLKNIVASKSMPPEQFMRSKSPKKDNRPPNFQDSVNEANTNQPLKGNSINSQTDCSSNLLKKSKSFKKLSNATNCVSASKQINANNPQNQLKKDLNKFQKGNQKRVSTQANEPTKLKKLRKKTLPAQIDGDDTPGYMRGKKSAVQKLIESPEFDQEKFQKIKQEEIKRFKQTSRDLSNTAFLTYFNKPPFENYGRQNKRNSGVLYGDYMYSHNIYPHAGDNHPQKQQTYITALSRAKSAGCIRPQPPMTRHLEEKLISGYLTLGQIYPKENQVGSIPIINQTCLENLPMFNYIRSDETYKRYNPYINANQNNDLFTVDEKYLKKQDLPKYFSNKEDIEGKQISYNQKISPCKKA